MEPYRLIDIHVPRRIKQHPRASISGLSTQEKQTRLMKRAERAASNIELQLLTDVITGSVVRLSNTANRSFLFVHDWETDRMRLSSINGEVYVPEGMELQFSRGEGAPGIVWNERRMIIANGPDQVNAIMETVVDADAILKAGRAKIPQAILCCPIIVYDEVIGAFLLEGTKQGCQFTPEDAVFLERLCTSIASSISSAVLTDELSLEKERLEALVEQVFVAQEDERLRIARDLHDSTCQTLALAAIRASACLDLVSPDQSELREELAFLWEDIKSAIQSVRDNVADLRPPILASHGLIACLESYVEDLNAKVEEAISFDPPANLPALPIQQSTLVFRIVQESVSNALRHSGANHVDISACAADGLLSLSVQDDGCGFSPESVCNQEGKSFGITGMMERAALLNGRCSIESRPGSGTLVKLSIPLETNPGRQS